MESRYNFINSFQRSSVYKLKKISTYNLCNGNIVWNLPNTKKKEKTRVYI